MTWSGRARKVVVLVALVLGLPASAGAQDLDLVPGMFVGTPDGSQELATYTERTPVGRLKPPRIARRRLTVTAVFAQVVDSTDPVRWRKLLGAVGASAENPPYVFVTMENDGQVRDFVVGVDLAATAWATMWPPCPASAAPSPSCCSRSSP